MGTDDSPRIITVFRSRLRPDARANGYDELAERIEQLAREAPGFVDIKTYAAEDGEHVSIAVFDSAERQRAWREDPEHREAQRRGREQFYAEYTITVCEERRHWHFPR